jgi:hypothetical protein
VDKVLPTLYDIRLFQTIADIFVAAASPYTDVKPGIQLFYALLQIAAKPLYHSLRLYKHFKDLKSNTPEKHADFLSIGNVVDRLRGHSQKVQLLKKVMDDFKTSVTLQDRIEGLDVKKKKYLLFAPKENLFHSSYLNRVLIFFQWVRC